MAEDPLTVVAQMRDAWKRGDPDEIAELFSADAEWVRGREAPLVGRDRIHEFLADYYRAVSDFTARIDHQAVKPRPMHPPVAPNSKLGRQIGAILGPMPSIQVKDVPDDVHATLRRRAAEARMSLQEYLLARLEQEANTPTLDELLDRAGGRAGGSAPLTAAVEAVRNDRDDR